MHDYTISKYLHEALLIGSHFRSSPHCPLTVSQTTVSQTTVATAGISRKKLPRTNKFPCIHAVTSAHKFTMQCSLKKNHAASNPVCSLCEFMYSGGQHAACRFHWPTSKGLHHLGPYSLCYISTERLLCPFGHVSFSSMSRIDKVAATSERTSSEPQRIFVVD